jgi:zinc protease
MKSPKILNINGSVVALYPMEEVESVSASLDFYAGSFHEGVSCGAHHLLEHVVFDGSEKFPTEEENEIYKEENGLSVGGSTGGDRVGYSLTAPKTKVQEGLTLLFDQVFRPIIRESDIEREKTVIAQEYKDKWSNQGARFSKALSVNMFGENHLYARDSMGEMPYVNSLTRDDLVKIQKEFITPANSRIVIVGKFNEAEVLSFVTSELESHEKGELKTLSIPDFATVKPVMRHNEDVKKVSIYLDWLSREFNFYSSRKEKITLAIARYLVGGSMRSILMKELRMKRGWVYGASASIGFSEIHSNFEVGTSIELSKFNDVLKLLHDLPREFANKGVLQVDYDRAINYLCSSQLMSYDSARAIGASISNDLYRSLDNKVYLPDEIIEIIRSIKQEEVLGMLTKYVMREPIINILASKEMKLEI